MRHFRKFMGGGAPKLMFSQFSIRGTISFNDWYPPYSISGVTGGTRPYTLRFMFKRIGSDAFVARGTSTYNETIDPAYINKADAYAAGGGVAYLELLSADGQYIVTPNVTIVDLG